MSTKSGVPDAWDDDWVNVASTPVAESEPTAASKLTKSQKRAQHQALQKQLWDSAENPTRMPWLETQGGVPLKQEFKPQVKLLSRKPQGTRANKDTANGIANLSLDDGDDSEEEARKKREAEFEERTRKAKIDREEKQRKYAEARERIMGSSTRGSGSPMAGSRESSQCRNARKPQRAKITGNRNSQPTSANQSPTRNTSSEKQLFDPEDMGRRMPKTTTPNPDAPTRQPRAPPLDHSSRGGFGFAGPGGRSSV